MKSFMILTALCVATVLSSCTTETIYYKEAKPTYRRSSSSSVTTLPGQAYPVHDGGSPSNFRAAD